MLTLVLVFDWIFPELFGVTFHLGCNPFLMLSCDFSSYISNLISHLAVFRVNFTVSSI
jgi:hypothetical protein